MKMLCLSIVMLLLLLSAGYAFDPNELRYGVYCTKDHFIIDDITALHDTLGLNFVYGITDSGTVPIMSQAGYDVIKWGSPEWVNPSRTSDYSYFKVEAEDMESPIRFETQQGDVSGDFLVSSDSGIMVGDLWFGQYPTQAYRGFTERKTFYAQVRLAIDTTNVALNDTIGRILVQRLEGDGSWSIRGDFAVLATQELLAGNAVEVPANPPFFWLCDQGSCNAWSYKVKYSFWNSGKTTVYLDYLKSYEVIGQQIVETTNYDDSIRASVKGGWKNDVTYWWLRDEPRFDHFRTMGKVRSLVNDTTGGLNCITAYLLSSVRMTFDAAQMQLGLKSFLQITGQDKVVINDYPFCGGTSSYFTDYTGDQEYDMSGPDAHRGLQKQFQLISCKFYDIIRQEIKDDTILAEFWSSPQCVFQVCDSSVGYTPPNTMYRWRPPTHSEHRLNLYLPLCYGARGLALWTYNWGHSSDLWDPACDPWSFGFYLSDTERNAPMWDVFVNDITPYIKAIDSVYMGLQWQRAYACSSGVPIDPPLGAFVSSISAISNPCEGAGDATDCENPDLGWFQVGEFTKQGATDKYFILLNRACSQGMWDPTEAPSITATVKFNPTNLGLGDYVYVIDLATDTDSADWVGTPETTYTAKMPDGTIPFTTTLRAGEGRLFKIAAANEIFWSGTIVTNFIYQGRMRITGDAEVPSARTLQIKGPARFEIYRCDERQSGQNQGLVELKVIGAMCARGDYSNPIEFYPDTVEMCDTLTRNYPHEGDWYGIYLQSGSACTLSYCSVAYADYGVEIRNTAHASISNSAIHDNKSIGLYCYQGYLNVTNSSINWNELYGVEGYDADVDVAYCSFLGDGLSGIKLVGSATSDMAHVEYDTVNSTTSTQQNGYGISISNTDSVSVYKCKVWGYTQSGLYLSNSDASIRNNDFSGNFYYGVYADNYSFPKIRQCRIDTLRIGVKTNQSKPNIGRITATPDSGNCSFLSCGQYYIYHTYQPTFVPDTMYAQLNYYGPSYNPGKFYWTNPGSPIKYLPTLLLPPGAPKTEGLAEIPYAFSLRQNYPNPFNPATTIAFTLDNPGFTRVTIYNLLGQRVTDLVSDYLDAGPHAVVWNGVNRYGETVSSGMYFYVIESGEHFETKKMVMVR